MTLVIKTRAPVAELVESVKKQVWSLDSQIPVSGIQSMDDLMAVSVARSSASTCCCSGSLPCSPWRWPG
jgi:hypothetical protein